MTKKTVLSAVVVAGLAAAALLAFAAGRSAYAGVLGITLDPPTATNDVGTDHTVTATVGGAPPGATGVTFTVTSGPNTGATFTCSANADCTTDGSIEVSGTYTGIRRRGAGHDRGLHPAHRSAGASLRHRHQGLGAADSDTYANALADAYADAYPGGSRGAASRHRDPAARRLRLPVVPGGDRRAGRSRRRRRWGGHAQARSLAGEAIACLSSAGEQPGSPRRAGGPCGAGPPLGAVVRRRRR